MKKMTFPAVILALAVLLSACGGKQAPAETTAATAAETTAVTTVATETTASQPLTLTGWNMTASTWSSPNGATIHITATPNYYSEEAKAAFVVRLENEEIASIPCQWDGTGYVASADLNAANGYCYYVVLTAADGSSAEVAVNTPEAPGNESFINMAAALESYCSVTVDESTFADGKLALSGGKVEVKTPTITNEGETITCQEAVLVLEFNGEQVGKQALTLAEAETEGIWEATLDNVSFDLPKMENNQKVELTLNVTLTNGHVLTAFGGNWSYSDDSLLAAFG